MLEKYQASFSLRCRYQASARSASNACWNSCAGRVGATKHSRSCDLVSPFTASTDSESEAVRISAATCDAASLLRLASTTSACAEPPAGNVGGDGPLQVRDVVDLVAHVRDVERQMLAADQVDVIGWPLPDGLDYLSRELHQAAGLAEALVLFEQSDDVLDRGMERIGAVDLVSDLLGTFRDRLRLHRLREGLTVRRGDRVDDRFVRKLAEEALAQDLVNLLARQFDRNDRFRLAIGLLLHVVNGLAQLLRCAGVGAGEVGDDDAAAFELEGGREQVGQRERRDLGQRAAADDAGDGVVEIGRQLIEKDENRLVADQVDPVLLGRRLRSVLPEPGEGGSLCRAGSRSRPTRNAPRSRGGR